MEAEGEDRKYHEGEGEDDGGEGESEFFVETFKDDANAKLIKSLMAKTGIDPPYYGLEYELSLRFEGNEDRYTHLRVY